MTITLWRPTLHGTLLYCRPLLESDYKQLFKAASDPLIWEQHPDRYRHTEERFKVFFNSAVESQGALVVFDPKSDEMIGSSRFSNHRPVSRSVEIGFTFLTRPYWYGLCNHELKSMMLSHAFQYVETCYFVVGRDNTRSRRAMGKIGGKEISDTSVPVETDFENNVVFAIKKATGIQNKPDLTKLTSTINPSINGPHVRLPFPTRT